MTAPLLTTSCSQWRPPVSAQNSPRPVRSNRSAKHGSTRSTAKVSCHSKSAPCSEGSAVTVNQQKRFTSHHCLVVVNSKATSTDRNTQPSCSDQKTTGRPCMSLGSLPLVLTST